MASPSASEGVRAYLRPPTVEGIERSERELAGAQPIALGSGAFCTVTLALDESRYDGGWTVDGGRCTVGVYATDVRASVDTSTIAVVYRFETQRCHSPDKREKPTGER